MASVSSIKLSIRIKGASALVRVRYNIRFDDYDRRTNLPYIEKCYLIGDDTNVGDSIFSGGDDKIPRENLTYRTVRSGGVARIKRDYRKTYSRHELNEDGWPDGMDEIRAKVALLPKTPTKTLIKESNLVRNNY
ncbi:MAG: hypothetical protein KAG10_06750 [Methylococcales bacterium]|nr:hypothetical protein [Methylococcales bacterium]MCK5925572.1 hypothetical protein [Methylococcales bacterium]